MLSCRAASTQTITTFNKFIRGAFSFVAALAWNAAIQNSLSSLSGAGGLYGYAFLVTILACIVLVGLTAFEKTAEKALSGLVEKSPLLPLKSMEVDRSR